VLSVRVTAGVEPDGVVCGVWASASVAGVSVDPAEGVPGAAGRIAGLEVAVVAGATVGAAVETRRSASGLNCGCEKCQGQDPAGRQISVGRSF
jgi:hypothetical protein